MPIVSHYFFGEDNHEKRHTDSCSFFISNFFV